MPAAITSASAVRATTGAAAALWLCAQASPAFAAEGSSSGPSEVVFIAQIVTLLALGFEGPLAVVDARGAHLQRPLRIRFDILVPVSGTEASRRAAEVAIAIARASDARVTALYITSPGGNRADSAGRPGRRRGETAVLRDVVEMADRYGVTLRTAVRVSASSDEAILTEVRTGRHNLIVMGVNRRPGEALFFGDVATAVLERSDHSLVLVSSGGASTSSQGGADKAGQQKPAGVGAS